MNKYLFYLMVFLGGCSYGVVSTFVKLSYAAGFGISMITPLQFITGVLLLWGACLFIKREKLTFKQFGSLLAKGIPLAFTGVLYNYSLQYINASFAIILLLQFTWISMVIRFIFDRTAPGKINIFAAAIILAGSVAASGIAGSSFNFSLKGIIFGLLAATSFASFIYISGKNSFKIHPVHKSAVIATGACVLVLILMPPVFISDLSAVKGILPFAAAAAFFGTFLSTILFNIGMPRSDSYGSILSASEMPMAVMMSCLVLHETVTLFQWAGVFIILFGIAVPNIKFKKLKLISKDDSSRSIKNLESCASDC